MSADVASILLTLLLWHYECHSVKITPLAALPMRFQSPEFSQNTSEPARVWTKQSKLLKSRLPPSPASTLFLCPQDEEWGAGVSSIKPGGMPTRGVIVMSCFVKSRPECHTASPFHPVHNGFRSKVCATEEATSWVQLTSHYLCRRTLSDLFAHLVSCADPHTQTKPLLKVLTCIVLYVHQSTGNFTYSGDNNDTRQTNWGCRLIFLKRRAKKG